jgi:D-alanine-D-alanine ligase
MAKKILIVFDAVSEDAVPRHSVSDEANPHYSAAEIIKDAEVIEKSVKSLGYSTALCDLRGTLKNLAGVVRKEKPDLIFNLAESLGEDAMGEIRVACFFELLEAPYTGSAPYALASALNKARAKEILNFHKIPTPKYFLVQKTSEIGGGELRLPLIIKPAREDGSIGINERSLVKNREDFVSGVQRIFREFNPPALVEEFIAGKEIHLAIFGNKNPEIMPIVEIDFSGLPAGYPRILTYDAKWRTEHAAYRGTPIICPAKINPALEKEIKNLALRVYRIFECRDYARIDFRLDEANRPFVLEVNPNPDISFDNSGFCKAAEAAGMDYTAIIKKIIDSAFERYRGHL